MRCFLLNELMLCPAVKYTVLLTYSFDNLLHLLQHGGMEHGRRKVGPDKKEVTNEQEKQASKDVLALAL